MVYKQLVITMRILIKVRVLVKNRTYILGVQYQHVGINTYVYIPTDVCRRVRKLSTQNSII